MRGTQIRKLVMVDDDEINNQLVGIIIEDIDSIKNYRIESSGVDALNYLEECISENEFPDLIIVDIKMPGMNGFEFIELYEERFMSRFPETKLMVLSSSAVERDIKKALEYKSVSNYIPKPLTEDKVFDILSSL